MAVVRALLRPTILFLTRALFELLGMLLARRWIECVRHSEILSAQRTHQASDRSFIMQVRLMMKDAVPAFAGLQGEAAQFAREGRRKEFTQFRAFATLKRRIDTRRSDPSTFVASGWALNGSPTSPEFEKLT
ncbi:hypothetical protein JQ633_33590 [Bradyrhizobium tropiciagri]|uniref:hypothetical protein n=1 Tax=Bradyrhizobium tropiciagri TaxID=312253 RepID=UPI001BAB8053|nr:hypothetical protein [Bradyrhizobium tropiciagri]MBR0875331.1 hypothetical protein [Bradyrhizobium tropiciagri]